MSSKVISKGDREALISEVQLRPAIWNDTDANYKNTEYVDINWREISQILNKEVWELKSKWKNLRAKMRKELLKMPHSTCDGPVSGWKSSWEFFDSMYFIRDVILATSTNENILAVPLKSEVRSTESGDECEIKCEPDQSAVRSPEPWIFSAMDVQSSQSSNASVDFQPQPSSLKRKRRQNDMELESKLELKRREVEILEKALTLSKQFQKNIDNADYNFLMSLLPYIEKLNLMDKLYLREQILKSVKDAYKKHLDLSKNEH